MLEKTNSSLIKKALVQNDSLNSYTKSLVIRDEGKHYLSIYNDQQTTKGVINAIARVKQAFPSLEDGFYKILMSRVKEKGLTDQQIMDSVNNVIDTCEYPTPVIGKFLSFDKKMRLYTYNEILTKVDQGESFSYYQVKEIEGIKWWIKKDEL